MFLRMMRAVRRLKSATRSGVLTLRLLSGSFHMAQ